jgi:hypothetical protein
VKEYDIFLPLRYNDGKSIESDKFQALQKELLDRFDGLTFFPQANQGPWKLGNVTYRDEIVIDRVLLTAALPMGRGRPTEARIRPLNACTSAHSPRRHQKLPIRVGRDASCDR